ncbi:phage tail tape measure protein [Amaricoccus tamworthensis]|uniref:phage tail tape measure protein n=1 Tax=Amaricoccus tamworthensis TaxID=57002 RepID=UPI003C7EC30E
MSEYDDGLNDLEHQFSGLAETIGGLESVASTFQQELLGVQSGFRSTGQDAAKLSNAVSSTVSSAFKDMIVDGKKLSDVLSGLGRNIANSALNSALSPIENAVDTTVGSGLSAFLGNIMPFANGGVFSNGRVGAFARGGVVDGPSLFPTRGGMGLMGEAGPEAIIPLARGADGRLGVKAGGVGKSSVNVTMNVSTNDAASFQRSQSQIAAEMNRAIQRGQRNL